MRQARPVLHSEEAARLAPQKGANSGFCFLQIHIGGQMPLSSVCSSFPDFQIHEMEDKLMEQKKYTLVVNKKRIPVTKEVYKAYYQHREHEVYEAELYSNNTISLEEAGGKGISLEYIIASSQNSMEDDIAQRDMLERLRQSLLLLNEAERQLIITLFYLKKSEHQLAVETGIPRMTIHNRKKRILSQLKKFLEK